MIELKNIKKEYATSVGAVPILKGITITIKDGEFVSITGPSGSGKSTLMNIIGALDVPTSGEYFLDGKDVSKFSDDELADIRKNKIGFVFQSFNLLPRATVLRNVGLPLVYAEVKREERDKSARESLKNAGLDEVFYDHLSNQLSGGQVQRVAIARALVNNPSLILAHEPTGNLDSKTGEIVLKTFNDLNKNLHHTVVLITHDINVANYADRVISIRDGLVVEDKKKK